MAIRHRASVSFPQEWTMLERHAAFFQGDNWDTNFITYSDFTAALESLDFGWERYLIAAAIIATGAKKTAETKTCCCCCPFALYRPNIARLLHPPADTGTYRPDGSAPFDEVKFLIMSKGKFYATEEDVMEYIQQRNGGKYPTFIQRGEFSQLYKILERKWRAGKRPSYNLSYEDMTHLFDGSLFFRLAGKPIPWEQAIPPQQADRRFY